MYQYGNSIASKAENVIDILDFTTEAEETPKQQEVTAAKKKKLPVNLSIRKEITQFFIRARKSNSRIANELGSRINIKQRKGTWHIDNLVINADFSSKVSLISGSGKWDGGVKIVYFKAPKFDFHYHEYSDRLHVALFNGYKLSKAGRGFIQAKLILNLTPEETIKLCGNTASPEPFMLATVFGAYVDSTLQEMPIYTDPRNIPNRAKNQKTNVVVRLMNGKILYLPSNDTREKITRELRTSFDPTSNSFDTEKMSFKQDIIYWNLDFGELKYISTQGQMMSLAIVGSVQLSPSATKSIFEASYEDFILTFGRTSGKESILRLIESFSTEKLTDSEERSKLNSVLYGENDPLHRLLGSFEQNFEAERLKQLFKQIKTYLKSEQAISVIPHPLRRYSVLAAIDLMSKYIGGGYNKLVQEIEEKIEKIQTATSADMPELPSNLDSEIMFIPHQADVLGKVGYADDRAIFNIATGGGKTLLFLCDIINQLNGGNISKPIIIMPPSLVSQWFNEIHSFTNSRMNVVVIATETMNKWGEEKVTEIIKTAPKNTIFITTYKWLSLNVETEIIGGRRVSSFPNVIYLQQFNFDYIGLDESHYIKNPESAQHQAAVALGQKALYKRMGTGTLMSNTVADIVGQMQFIDPAVFGNKKDFLEKYGLVVEGDKIQVFKEGALEDIHAKLASVGTITKTRKDWFYVLPKIIDRFHTVKMTPNQQAAYTTIVTNETSALNSDPVLAQKWQEFIKSGAEDIPEWLLPKLMMIDAFASDPGSSYLATERVLEGADVESPKMPVILKILDEHFSKTPDEKVLIFTQHAEKVVPYVYKSLGPKYKPMAVRYRGGMKENLEKFKNDPNIKILVGCDKSLTVGHNLQVASRMIRLDVPWNAGDLDQVIARLYRFDPDGNNRDLITIDWVLADQSIDILKFKRTIAKLIQNSVAMDIIGENEIPPRPIYTVTVDMLMGATFWEDTKDAEAADYQRFRELEKEKWEELRKTMPSESVPIKIKGNIEGEIIDTPWVDGAIIPNTGDKETVTVDDAVDDDNIGAGDPRKVIGYRCRTEYGLGTIVNCKKSSKGGYLVAIDYDDDEERKNTRGGLVEFINEKDPNAGKVVFDVKEPGIGLSIGSRYYWLTPRGILHKTLRSEGIKRKLGKRWLIFKGTQWLTMKGRAPLTNALTPKVEEGLYKNLKKLGYKFPTGYDPSSKDPSTFRTFPYRKKKWYVNVKGEIGLVSEKTGEHLKPNVFFRKGSFIDGEGGRAGFAKRIEIKIKSFLIELGYKEPPSRKPRKTSTKDLPKDPGVKEVAIKRFREKGIRLAITEEGKIYKILKSGNLSKTVAYKFVNGKWIKHNGKEAKFSVPFTAKLGRYLEGLGYEAPKPKKEAKPKVTRKGAKKTETDKGYVFTIKGKYRIMLPNGNIHVYGRRDKSALKLKYEFSNKNKTWFTPSGRDAKFNTRDEKRLLSELGKLRGKVFEEPAKTKTTEISPVELYAINFGGMSSIGVDYTDEDTKKATFLALKSYKFKPFPYFQMLINQRNAKLLMKALDKDLITPAYYSLSIETLESVLENWRRPLVAMQSIPKDFVTKIRTQIRKDWRMHPLMLIPTYIDGRLYITIPSMRQAAYKNYIAVLKKLRFKEREILIKTLLRPSQIIQAGSFAINALKAKKIAISNIKDFRSDIKVVKKQLTS